MFSKLEKNDGKKPTQKRKHVTLNIKQKLEIIAKLDRGENRNAIMEEYNIGSSTIYDIRNQRAKLEAFVSKTETTKAVETRQTTKKPKSENLDSALYTWFSAKRSEGKPVTGPMLIEKAKLFEQELNLEEDKCTFSSGWLHKFKVRHGIRKLDFSGEAKSADVVAANEFKIFFQDFVEKNDLSPFQVYNADETGLLWRCLPNSTLAGHDEKSAKGFKMNKDRLTVLCCGNASGDHKLKLFVIGKYKKPRAFKGLAHLPVHYAAQSNAWMSAELFKDWFFDQFVPSVKSHFVSLGKPEDTKAVLLLDNCRAHPSANELTSGNISVVYLPPNVTPLIQPMDQGVIQNFKCKYRGSFIQELVVSKSSVKDFQAKFNIKDAIFTAALSWNDVQNETVKRSWRKLWPGVMNNDDVPNENDPIEDDEDVGLQINLVEIKEKTSEMSELRNIPSTEIVEWLEIDKVLSPFEEISDESIVQSVLNQKPVQDESESDDEEVSETKVVSWNEASEAINTFVKFAESNKQYSMAEVMNLHIIKNDFLNKKNSCKKQVDIRYFFQPSTSAVAKNHE